MTKPLASMNQVIAYTPKVGQMVAGQLAATDIAAREAQLAKAQEMQKRAETVSELIKSKNASQINSEGHKDHKKKRSKLMKKKPNRELEIVEDEEAIIDVRI